MIRALISRSRLQGRAVIGSHKTALIRHTYSSIIGFRTNLKSVNGASAFWFVDSYFLAIIRVTIVRCTEMSFQFSNLVVGEMQ